ncbi:MAG: MBL fold metallo-hydrolase [Thermoanaerobaculia bacterium]
MTKSRLALLPLLLLVAVPARLALAQAVSAPSGPPPLPKDVPAFQVGQYNAFTWYGRFGYTNLSFVDTGDGVLVIDTGWTKQDGENLKAQIAEKTKGKPVRWIVMTQTDVDSNGGIAAFLPTDATIFVHARALDPLSAGALRAEPGQKKPTIVGVADHLVLNAGGRRFELLAAPGRAHSEYDLVVYNNDSGLVWSGDLITPARCPNLTNPASDPQAWIEMIGRIQSLGAIGMIPTRGDATKAVADEIEKSRAYIERVLRFVAEQKVKNSAEARVAAELSMKKIGDYCPLTGDNANVIGLFRRMKPDGTFRFPGEDAPARPAAPAPR